MSIYTDGAATVTSLLSEYGMDMTLTEVSDGVYTPGTGVSNTDTDYAATGIKRDYDQRVIDGTVIRQGDQLVTLSPSLEVTPKTGDKLTIDGEVWGIISSHPISPAGTIVAHKVQVRK